MEYGIPNIYLIYTHMYDDNTTQADIIILTFILILFYNYKSFDIFLSYVDSTQRKMKWENPFLLKCNWIYYHLLIESICG